MLSRHLNIAARTLGALLSVATGSGFAWSACAAAQPLWSPAELAAAGGLGPVSCPTTGLCVAGSSDGFEVSTDPTGGPAAWETAPVFPGDDAFVDALSCTPAGACVAGDTAGNLIATADARSGTWTALQQPAGIADCNPESSCDPVTGVSCLPGLCVAVSADGQVLTSKDPTATADAWTVRHVPHASFEGVSCPTTALCVALGGNRSGMGIFTATNPQGGAGAWRFTRVPWSGVAYGVACPTTGFCAAATNFGGRILTSTDPAARASSWKATVLGSIDTGGLGQIGADRGAFSCAGPSLCVLVNGFGNAVVATHPTEGVRAWASVTVVRNPANEITNQLDGVSCPAPDLCVATDLDAEEVWTSTDPGAPASLAPRVSRAALQGAGTGALSLTLSLQAAPGAGEIDKFSIAAGYQLQLAAKHARIKLADDHGEPLPFTAHITRAPYGLALTPARAVESLELTLRRPAIALPAYLARLIRTRHLRTLLLQIIATTSQGRTIIVATDARAS